MSEMSFKWMEKLSTGISFRNQVFFLILVLLTLQLSIIGYNFHSALVGTLEDQVGKRALIQAREIASDPELIKH